MLNRMMVTNKFKPESLHVAKHEGVIIDPIPSQAFLFGGNMGKFKRMSGPPCACGCGERVKWCNQRKRWNKFVCGHSSRGKNNPIYGKNKYKEQQKLPPFCGCGCGEKVNWNVNYKEWNKFINGHSRRTSKFFETPSIIIPLCGCGCGEKVIWSKKYKRWNKYIYAHHMNGRKLPLKTKIKISKKTSGKNNPMYGKSHSEESKRKMSISTSGIKNPMYGKIGIDNPNYGKKKSEETKEKMRGLNNPMYGKYGEGHPNYGKEHSKETCKKISIGLTGHNHPNRKGGITAEPYCEIWMDKEYKQSIRDRDNNECQNPDCWHTADHLLLVIHHINYIKKDCHPSNLITLCSSCNIRANFKRNYWEDFYLDIMIKKYGYKYE